MQLATFRTRRSAPSGWSVDPLPALDSAQTLVVVFGASDQCHDAARIEQILKAYPTSHVLGCSSVGETFGATIYDDSQTVAVLRFEQTRLASACTPVAAIADSFAAGRAIAAQLAAPDLRGVFVLSDGLSVNGSELVTGLNSLLPESVVVTGGLAGDGGRFQQTWVLAESAARAGFVTAVGFYGDAVRIGHGSQGGWDAFGPERRVTRSQGNVVYELDGQPALDLYRSYLGEYADELPGSALFFPLTVRADERDEKTLIRTILSIDEETHALRFAGDVPQGSLARLTRGKIDRLIDGAGVAAEGLSGCGDAPALSIAVSCVGRRIVLGERTDEELEAILDVLPRGTQQIGFYSYGEISPYRSGHCDFHNQTMTLTTISES